MDRDQYTEKFLSRNDLVKMLGVSRATLLRLEGRDDFPDRLMISEGRVGWLYSEMEAWMRARPTLPKVQVKK